MPNTKKCNSTMPHTWPRQLRALQHGPLLLLKVLVLLALMPHSDYVHAFNYAPQPNYVIYAPQHLKTFMPQVRSSYFGYSLVIRPTSILVGAPRAQSTLESQRKVNEPGAIYRCSLTNGTCAPYVFDKRGNVVAERSEYTFDSENRTEQWLGASMDGGTQDTDKLLVCAPRFFAPSANDYHLHGLCYWVANTLSDMPINVTRISPLRLKQEQVKEENKEKFYYYIFAEQGFSAHVTDDNEEMILGAPGIYTWKGSVIRYRKKMLDDDPVASRRDVSSKRRKVRDADYSPEVTYVSDIPNPGRWGQPSDSYFGYSVGSGYFDSNDPKKLLYVATAPQAHEQSGEAYIFDIHGQTITKFFVFRGEQFGEYFGYAVLAEDLNGDGLTDVIVSAPQYSLEDSNDNGAIYVFINQGRFNFERKLLKSPVKGKARFGTTLARLGDINHDGYNDFAVGAPFANNGSVFVYLGAEKGVREQPSQRLNSPNSVQSKYGEHMFGHGLSKGADIDNNGFNDFAIGAPNAEALYVYRAYPVVKVLATVQSQAREIRPEQSKFQLTACYAIFTTSTKINQQDLAIRIVLDPKANRVKFSATHSNELSFNATAGTTRQCRLLDCDVRFSVADIFKPIELEMHYDIIKGVPNSEEFCETCAAVDPVDPKVYIEKIIFSTGCATDICVADLKVKSNGLGSYILGSSDTLKINYEITNNGETAYLPQFNVTSSNRMNFAQIPSNCKVSDGVVMLCDLNRGQPMSKGSKDTISVSFDVSSISGLGMTITAEVFSTGRELKPADNVVRDVIALKEYTEVEATGAQTSPHIDLEHYKNSAEIINSYEVKSNGPSTVGALELVLHIPVAYKVAGSQATIPIINVSNITMQAVYDAQLVGVDLIDQNNTQILMDTIEISSNSGINHMQTTVVRQNGMHYDSVNSGHVNEMSSFETTFDTSFDTNSVVTASMSRRSRTRRDLAALTASREEYARISNVKAHDLLSDDFKGKLPVNRTIVFNCRDPQMTVCVRATMRVYNFKPEKPISINMRYHVNLNEINEILIEPWEFFVILIDLGMTKIGSLDMQSLKVVSKIEPTIISKHQMYGTPLWVIILAILGGLLLLAAITYGMYKAGFFKRTTKEEMDKLVHQGVVEPEAENLNSGNN